MNLPADINESMKRALARSLVSAQKGFIQGRNFLENICQLDVFGITEVRQLTKSYDSVIAKTFVSSAVLNDSKGFASRISSCSPKTCCRAVWLERSRYLRRLALVIHSQAETLAWRAVPAAKVAVADMAAVVLMVALFGSLALY